MDLEKYKNIKNIYRFFSQDDYNFTGLASQYLWFSKVDAFNDPFENEIIRGDFDFSKLSKEELVNFFKTNETITFGDPTSEDSFRAKDIDLERLLEEKYEEIIPKVNDIVLEHAYSLQSKYFHCLSHDQGDVHPLENRLLWSHYASGLRGFVIEFNVDAILNSINNINSDKFIGCGLISYIEHNYDEFIKGEILKEESLNINDMLFNKHPDWEYESEIRLISDAEKLFYHPESISRIIVGDKMAAENREHIYRIALSKGIESKLYVATIDRGNFTINVTKGLYKN
ncbi:DUF2971 domain-containing protein [Vibrio diabolicus]|uniref:DUF2971 domain-containing protein n=1 Tax=Vibrio diabolicus TaxID=50719 RepID=UPI0037533D49